MYIFTIITFLFFKKIKSFITPLNFIFVTYYYLAKKKKDPIFKANFIHIYIYIYFIIFVIDFALYFNIVFLRV